METNIEINEWYDLYDKEHKIPDTYPENTELWLMLEHGVIVKDDSNWDEEHPCSMVTHWQLRYID